MRIRSTGLGKTELVGEIESIQRKGDYLIVSMRTVQPVRWHVRVALTPKDLLGMLKSSGLLATYLLSNLRTPKDGPAPPPDY
ncbi:MAG: hypothetical protein HY675_04370 [Chloroflexi bacterium]|nr:hypothetical protein [Chloroflexota bacterium]